MQNSSIIQNNSVTISYPELGYLCKTHVPLFARYLFFFDIKGLKIVKWVVDIYVARLAERCTIILFNNKTYLYYLITKLKNINDKGK